MIDGKIIGKRLTYLRGERSRRDVATIVGASERAIIAYEMGERIPRDEMKRKLALLYGRTVEEIFFAEKVHFE